jgi:transposase
MAMQLSVEHVGVDVSKEYLQIDGSRGGRERLRNSSKEIRPWLKALAAPSCVAVEATNSYHRCFVELAHRLGHTVYLVDGYRLSRYRDGVGGRAKTDRCDAQLLRRYLEHEKAHLRPWEPPPEGYTRLMQLLHRRERVVSARTALRQSMADVPDLKRAVSGMLRRLKRLEEMLTERIVTAARSLGWGELMRRCDQIEGIGTLTAAALATVFQRGHFRSADAFVAFLGLDVRPRDSGTYRGKRKLSKQGDTELRRLLYLAAMKASHTPAWSDFYQRHAARLSKTEALTALSRKLARVAFALMRNGTDYVPRLGAVGPMQPASA